MVHYGSLCLEMPTFPHNNQSAYANIYFPFYSGVHVRPNSSSFIGLNLEYNLFLVRASVRPN